MQKYSTILIIFRCTTLLTTSVHKIAKNKHTRTDVLQLRKSCTCITRQPASKKRKKTTTTQSPDACKYQHLEDIRRHHKSNGTNTNMNHCSTKPDKGLCLADYDIIGFDLDCTLIRYSLTHAMSLEYNAMKEYLVKERSYPKELLEKPLDWDFLQKGLVVDTKNGNIVKLAHDGLILRATHGTRVLSNEEICKCYGVTHKWDTGLKFVEDPVKAWNSPVVEKLRCTLDYYDMPAALIFAQVIDLIDEADKKPQQSYTAWEDVLASIVNAYARDNFQNDKSIYFNGLRSHPERYIMRTSDAVIEWLCNLRAQGTMIFLLTGSNVDFANYTSSYAFRNPNWLKLFDVTVTYAKKPGFFTMRRPFLCVNNLAENKDAQIDLQANLTLNSNVYSQGNWKQLHASMCKALGKNPLSVRTLYFGDNVVQDVYAPVKYGNLDAVAISEELAGENNSIDERYEFKEAVNSNTWNSYFSLNDTHTLWAHYIDKYARLCIPTLDHIAQHPINERLNTKNGYGYYPTVPKKLEDLYLY